jgi:hypothetical protein
MSRFIRPTFGRFDPRDDSTWPNWWSMAHERYDDWHTGPVFRVRIWVNNVWIRDDIEDTQKWKTTVMSYHELGIDLEITFKLKVVFFNRLYDLSSITHEYKATVGQNRRYPRFDTFLVPEWALSAAATLRRLPPTFLSRAD